MKLIVLVTGGRDFTKRRVVFSVLDVIHSFDPIGLIVQGYAIGTDRLADDWAEARGVPSTGDKYRVTPDMWRRQGKAAGHIRNARMFKLERPDIVLAFPGGRGTAGMCEIATEGGVKPIRIDHKGNVIE